MMVDIAAKIIDEALIMIAVRCHAEKCESCKKKWKEIVECLKKEDC